MIFNIDEIPSISKAINLLIRGEIIIYPTDTLYGFGVDATNSIAINKLNLLKKRKQPYSILVSDMQMIKKYSVFSKEIGFKLDNIFPGPYTAILEKSKNNGLSQSITLGLETIGIRIPKNKFALNLVRELGKPIITTSVNRHGNAALNNIDEIKKVFNNIALFKDNSLNNNSLGSTIIDYTVKPEKILRYGDE